jgi:uncharacterized protein (DUF4415 family)
MARNDGVPSVKCAASRSSWWRTHIAIMTTTRKFASFRPEWQPGMKGSHTNEKIVSKKLKDLPSLTEAYRERLVMLIARRDSEIDLSDIPELTEEDWKTAVRSKHYRPVKAQITAHLDKDVLAWLKADGRGYQTHMNAILRREMLQARSSDQQR